MTKERRCIQASNTLKVEWAKDELKKLNHEKMSSLLYVNVPKLLKDAVRSITWKPTLLGKLVQLGVFMLVIPIAPMFGLLMWLVDLIDWLSKMYTLKKGMRQCKRQAVFNDSSDARTLLELWNLYGMNYREHGKDRCVQLLNQWLEILYEEGTADRLDVAGRCRRMGLRHARANIPYYTEEDAPHFFFRNPFDCVLEQVSGELPHHE